MIGVYLHRDVKEGEEVVALGVDSSIAQTVGDCIRLAFLYMFQQRKSVEPYFR